MTGKPGNRWLVGPLVITAGVMAACWLGVAVAVFRAATSPALGLLAWLSLALSVVLAIVGLRMVVLVRPGDLRVLGRTPLSLADIDQVTVSRLPGSLPIFVPVVLLRRGRALVSLELDGLSGLLGDAGARRRAAAVAAAVGCGEVSDVAAPVHAAARRRQDA